MSKLLFNPNIIFSYNKKDKYFKKIKSMKEEIAKTIIDNIKSFNLGHYILYDKKGNKTFNYSEVKKIFIIDYNCLIMLGEKNLTLFLMNDDLLKNKKEFFNKLKNIAIYFGKTFKFENLNRKFTPSEFSNINENINNLNTEKKISTKGIKKMIKSKKNFKLIKENVSKYDISPETKKWLSLLLNMYEYSSGGSFNKNSIFRDEKELKTFIKQAERLANKTISKSAHAKPLKTETQYSHNEEIRNNQILNDYYSSLSQLIDSSKDAIVGNIISRLADHYFFKIADLRTTFNENSSNFKALEKFADYIGNMLNFKKENFIEKVSKQYENSFKKIEENLFEWFSKFTVGKIFLKENKKEKKSNKKKRTDEGKDARKASAVAKSSEKIITDLDKIGSPREIAFKKAIYYMTKGIDPKEALTRSGLPINNENLKEIKKWAVQAGLLKNKNSDDKYELMYKELEKKSNLPKEPEKQVKSQLLLSNIKKK